MVDDFETSDLSFNEYLLGVAIHVACSQMPFLRGPLKHLWDYWWIVVQQAIRKWLMLLTIQTAALLNRIYRCIT
jgi:hypothetical protein